MAWLYNSLTHVVWIQWVQHMGHTGTGNLWAYTSMFKMEAFHPGLSIHLERLTIVIRT